MISSNGADAASTSIVDPLGDGNKLLAATSTGAFIPAQLVGFS